MRRLLLAISAVSLLACADSSGPRNDSAEGKWNLITIDGSPLPFTTPNSRYPGAQYQIMSEQFVAHPGGAWSNDFTFRVTSNGVATTTTRSMAGTWVQSGSIVTVTTSDGPLAVSIVGDRITLANGGVVFVYARAGSG